MTFRRAFLKGLCGVAPLGDLAPAAIASPPPKTTPVAAGRDDFEELGPRKYNAGFERGNPSIETRLVDGVSSVNTWCLDPEHVPIVRRRVGEVLRGRA